MCASGLFRTSRRLILMFPPCFDARFLLCVIPERLVAVGAVADSNVPMLEVPSHVIQYLADLLSTAKRLSLIALFLKDGMPVGDTNSATDSR